MAKKPAASPAAADLTSAVNGQELKDIYFALYGNEKEYDELREEHFVLTHYYQLKAEQEKEIIAERRRKRREICEARRQQEELRRIKEMRDNPENLYLCAAKIQKFVRRNLVMKEYGKVRGSLAEKPQKHALLIIGNHYEDRRVRIDAQAVSDTFDLARVLLCMGFKVELLCDVPPYDEFIDLYDEPLAASDSSGRCSSLGALPTASPSPIPGARGGDKSAQQPQSVSGTSTLMRSVLPPTRQNITKALDDIAKAPSDTLVWVHVCCVGGRAAVNGKNPSRTAAEAMIKTPRTRLLNALHEGSVQRVASTGATDSNKASASDTCHFIFPSDGRSARLTFDNIVRIEEVLDILSPRHSEQIFGHPLHQRIVSIDVTPIGCVEGHQGGGFSVFGSTCSATRFWEHLPKEVPQQLLSNVEGPSRGCSLGDPNTSLLTYALQQVLTGHCWSRIDSTPALYCSHLVAYLDRWMAKHGAVAEIRGQKGWSTFKLFEGDKLASNIATLERVFGFSTSAHSSLSVGGATSSSAVSSTASTAAPTALVPSRRPPRSGTGSNNNRGVCFETVLRLDITEDRNGVKGLDVFDPEFPPLLLHILLFFAQHDPSVGQQYRQLKAPLLRANVSRSVLIGIQSNFVEISAKTKGRGTGGGLGATTGGGGEAGVWPELVSELTGVSVNSPSLPKYAVNIAKQHEGGGILLTLHIPRADILDKVLRRLDKIPDVIPGVVHNAVMIDIRCELFSTVSVMEQLALRARQVNGQPTAVGMIQPMTQQAADGDTLSDKTKSEHVSGTTTPAVDTNLEPPVPTFATAPSIEAKGNRSVAAGASMQRASSTLNKSLFQAAAVPTAPASAVVKHRSAASGDGSDGVGSYLVALQQLSNAVEQGMTFTNIPSLSAPSSQVMHAWGDFLDYCVQQLGNKTQKVVKIIKHKLPALRIMHVRPLAMRVNELEDVGFALMGRRERPPTPLALHAGMAVCVVALYSPTSEARCRQLLHLQRVAQSMEVVGGIRFLLWDVNNETFGLTGGAQGARGGGGLAAVAAVAASQLQQSVPAAAAAAAATGAAANAAVAIAGAEAAAPAVAVNPRATVLKFLETLKLSIGTNAAAYPCLMLWDMARKRYYRLKSQPNATSTAALSPSLPGGATKPPFVTGVNSTSPVAGVESPRPLESSRVTPMMTGRASVVADSALPSSRNAISPDLLSASASVRGGGVSSLLGGPVHHYHSTAHLIYPSSAVAHLCDEFLRGGLNELLPPVKGSKVVGGGHSTTKYSLIPL